MMLTHMNNKIYATAEAYIVDSVDQLPRELASEIDRKELNPSFLWVAGRYVQANNANRNGHYWTVDDLQKGQSSIRYTPLNALHQWEKPIGTLVETKIVHREDVVEGSDRLLPEIQALGVMWAANFPEVAAKVKDAHEKKQLYYSMECVAESKQCLTCDEVFPYRAQAHEMCKHLAESAKAPRRFINPIFLGGALIFPPERPAWPDADITEVARQLVSAHANREVDEVSQWENLMEMVLHE